MSERSWSNDMKYSYTIVEVNLSTGIDIPGGLDLRPSKKYPFRAKKYNSGQHCSCFKYFHCKFSVGMIAPAESPPNATLHLQSCLHIKINQHKARMVITGSTNVMAQMWGYRAKHLWIRGKHSVKNTANMSTSSENLQQ